MGGSLHVGVVTSFDEARGLGTVTEGRVTEGAVAEEVGEDAVRAGTPRRSWSFHCTAIADGTRTVEVGTPVAFELRAGHLGRIEATRVTTLGS